MAVRTTTSAGNWNAAIWDGAVPGDGDSAILNHAVTLTANQIVGTSPASSADAITINFNSGGTLTLNTDIQLTLRGDCSLLAAYLDTGAVITMSPGSIIEIDESAAASPYTTEYGIKWEAVASQFQHLQINGTVGNPCIIRSNAGGANGFLGGASAGSGQVRGTYCNCADLGTASTYAFQSKGNTSVNYDFSIDHFTFANCGEVRITSGFGAAGTLSVTDCEFAGGTGSYSVYLADTADVKTTGSVTIQNNVFDNNAYLLTPLTWNITNNYFGGGYTLAGTLNWTSFADNIVLTTGAGSMSVRGNVEDSIYFVTESGETNDHFLTLNDWETATTTIIHDGNIFCSANNSSNGDCYTVGEPSAAETLVAQNSIILPNPDRLAGCGTLFSALGNANVTLRAYHNTAWGAAGVVGETYVGHTGMLNKFQSNLFYYPSSGSSQWKLYDTGTDDNVSDLVASGDADYNSAFNHNAGTNLKGYDSLEFSSGSPGANDVDDIDPGFVDDSRTIATYDTDSTGLNNSPGTTWADATGYTVGDVVSATTGGIFGGDTINYRCVNAHTSAAAHATNGQPHASGVTNWSTNWEYQTLFRLREDMSRIPAMVTWIKGGFAPTNIALKNAGHDVVTIGAVEGIFPPLPQMHRYYEQQRA